MQFATTASEARLVDEDRATLAVPTGLDPAFRKPPGQVRRRGVAPTLRISHGPEERHRLRLDAAVQNVARQRPAHGRDQVQILTALGQAFGAGPVSVRSVADAAVWLGARLASFAFGVGAVDDVPARDYPRLVGAYESAAHRAYQPIGQGRSPGSKVGPVQ